MNISNQLNAALATLRLVASVAYGKKSGEGTGGGAGNIGMIGGVPIKFNTKFGERTVFGRADAVTREHMKNSCDELRNRLADIIGTLLRDSAVEADEMTRSLGMPDTLLKRTTIATSVERIYKALKKKYGATHQEAFRNSDTIWTDDVMNDAVRTQAEGSIAPFKERWALVHQERQPGDTSDVNEDPTTGRNQSPQEPMQVRNLVFDEPKVTGKTPLGGNTMTPDGNTMTPVGNTMFEGSTPLVGNTMFEGSTPLGGNTMTPDGNTPQFANLHQPMSLRDLETKISRNEQLRHLKVPSGEERNYLFAKYLLYFRPGVENFDGSVERFLDRVGNRLNLSTRVNDWAGTNTSDSSSFKQNLFNCFKSSPNHPLFAKTKYDMLFSDSDPETEEAENYLADLGDEFMRDLEDLMKKRGAAKRPQAEVKIPVQVKKNTMDEQMLRWEREQANKKSAEENRQLSAKALKNNSKEMKVEIRQVDDVYEASGLKKPVTNVKIEPSKPDPKDVIRNEWNRLENKWKATFDGILDEFALQGWKDTTGHQDVEGFKALVTCLIDKDGKFMDGIRNSRSTRASLVRLQQEFETVFKKLDIAGKCGSRKQSIGEFVYDHVRNLPNDSPINTFPAMLLNGEAVNPEKGMDEFREALEKVFAD